MTPDTCFALLSATKVWSAVSIHQLAEAGRVDYDARVAEYWPEFARHGKGEVTVRQAISHRGGFPLPAREADPDRAVEESVLRWPPGSANAYHFSNFGDAIAGIVRRVDGRTIQHYVREEVFERVGMPDAFLGERPDRPFPDYRVAWIYEVETGTPGAQYPAPAARPEPWHDEYAFIFNRPDVQRQGRPSGNGVAAARDLARIYGALANAGVVDGMDRPLLRPETIDAMSRRTNSPGEVDRYMQLEIAWGMGVHLGGRALGGRGIGVATGDECSFGHGGGACTLGWADPVLGIGCAYLTNGNLRWGERPFRRTGEVADLIRKAAIP